MTTPNDELHKKIDELNEQIDQLNRFLEEMSVKMDRIEEVTSKFTNDMRDDLKHLKES